MWVRSPLWALKTKRAGRLSAPLVFICITLDYFNASMIRLNVALGRIAADVLATSG